MNRPVSSTKLSKDKPQVIFEVDIENIPAEGKIVVTLYDDLKWYELLFGLESIDILGDPLP